MELRRWTTLTMLVPWRYVDRSERWREFDLADWSASDYKWVEDPWNGYLDFAKRPGETVADGVGDCEDYALVALSWAIANDRDGVGIGFCWEWPYPWPRHVIAFDDERVYSSGNVVETDPDSWVEDSKYVWALKRRVE